MAERGFFRRLALVNLVRNRQYYGPYLLSCGGAAAMFYILCFLTWNDMIATMPGRDILQAILYLGCIVVAIFSAVILLYANSFVMKRRQRELGLYNVLGLEKRHIARVCLWEALMTGSVSILGGIGVGVLLSKLILLLLCKLVRFPVQMGFAVSGMGVGLTAGIFVGLTLLALLANLVTISRAKPIELLHSDSVGEREPKTKWLLTVVGVVALGVGYGIAIVVESPVQALALFFVAVLLVMLGTYCLFTAGTIALLKLLRRNPKFYYQTKHFVSISGLLYRMKQNAVGLSNICILSTMVLVTLSTTVSLYLGSEDILRTMYPAEVITRFTLEEGSPLAAPDLRAAAETAATQSGRKVELLQDYPSLELLLERSDAGFRWLPTDGFSGDLDYAIFQVLTAEDYGRLTGQAVVLETDQALWYSKAAPLPEALSLGETSWRTQELEDWTLRVERTDALGDVYYLVVSDQSAMQALYEAQRQAHGDRASNLNYTIFLDVDGTDAEKKICAGAVQAAVWDAASQAGMSEQPHTWNRAAVSYEFYTLYGSFLFLGLFLGLIFLMTTALIIYYKQISEGYEDRRRFAIMGQVGMSQREVRASIRGQILLVFFLPLGMAAIHILAAFPMITRLLRLFSLSNVPLFALCTVVTLLIFALLYALIYSLTARCYYQIVRE